MKKLLLSLAFLATLSIAARTSAVPVLSIQNTQAGFEIFQDATTTPNYPGFVTFKITSPETIPAGTRVSYLIERVSSFPGGRTAEYNYDFREPVVTGQGVTELNTGLLVFTGANTGGVTLSFPVSEDRFVEGTEQFQVRLYDPKGCTLGQDKAIGDIVDDDEGWNLRLQGRVIWTSCHTPGGVFSYPAYVDPAVVLGDRPQMAVAELQGDMFPEIIIGSGSGPVATVTILDSSGTPKFSFQPFGNFTGGVYVATGDMNGDGIPEVVCGSGAGGIPLVNVYNLVANGPLGSPPGVLYSFFAATVTFTGGIRVGCGDVNHDGIADFVTCTGPGTTNQTFVYSGQNGSVMPDPLYNHYGAFAGGAYVAMCDLDHDGYSDILLGAGEGGGSHVKVWSAHRGIYLTEFFMDSLTSGVITGGQPVVIDPRGISNDARYPTAHRRGTILFAHPSDNIVKYSFDAGGSMFPEIYGVVGFQAIAGWVPLEPFREHDESSLPASPVKPYLLQIEPVEPGVFNYRREIWLYQRRRGFRYDLETSTDLTHWNIEAAGDFGTVVLEENNSRGKFFRIRERPYTPGGG